MITKVISPLDLSAIADSGQCFRWQKRAGGYRIFAGDKILHAAQNPGREEIRFSCTEEEFSTFWADYFDLATDYRAILSSVPPEDSFLQAAAAYGQGLRILRQEPWETLITFILSQRKSIPAIQRAVESLCAACGKQIGEEAGEALYAFPAPEDILSLSLPSLAACGLGYRTEYVRRAAQAFCQGDISCQSLNGLSDEALLEALCALHGVGPKIASCVMLFGFHRLNAFPMDVWMYRVEKTRYPQGIPAQRYAPWGGVMQQYMFAYERHLAKAEKEKKPASAAGSKPISYSI